MSLQTKAIFAGIVAGVIVGVLAPGFSSHLLPLETVFLRLIKAIVGPLVFATIVVGIAGSGDPRQTGRIGLKAILYFEAVATLALVIGLVVANVSHPGRGISLSAAASPAAAIPQERISIIDSLVAHSVPQSFAEALANGEILQIVVFSCFFGIALATVGARAKPMLGVIEALAQVMFRFTGYVMWYAPIGVFGAMAVAIGAHGVGILGPLLKLNLAVLLALALFVVVVLGGIAVLAQLPIRPLFEAIREPFLLAFSASNSEVALPRALENMEAMGVPRSIVGFVIPAGYSFNMDGSTLYMAFAMIFLAQTAGVHLSLGRQLVIMATLMLTSKGVAGVARSLYPILLAMAANFGLPLEGVALLLGVDHFMNMGRACTNVAGNCVAAAVVARWEGVRWIQGKVVVPEEIPVAVVTASTAD